MSYYEDKADILMSMMLMRTSDNEFRRALITTLMQVAKDQRTACVDAYFDIPDDAEWDPDIVIKNAEIK